jgi:hypothetical protein
MLPASKFEIGTHSNAAVEGSPAGRFRAAFSFSRPPTVHEEKRSMTETVKTRVAALQAGPSRRDFLNLTGAAAVAAAAKLSFPSGAFAQAAGPEVKGTKLGYIALTDAAPLIIAKEKGLYAKYGMPDMEIAQAGFLGCDARQHGARLRRANGIDGGHILRPKVHLYSTGKVMQNNQPLADVHAAEPERGRAGDLGLQRVQGSQ